MKGPNQRGHFRVDYPLKYRPSLVVGDRALRVIDCSESGLQYIVPESDPVPEIGDTIAGTLRFRGGEEVEIEGVLAWLKDRRAAVRFEGLQIPFSSILREQHYLRAHFLRHLERPGS